MKYFVTINEKQYEVVVEREKSAANHETVSNQSPQPGPVSGAGIQIKAPMPGTIINIKVAPGQAVKKGDVLFVLEAMKMENEIMADHNTVIKQVLVSKGTAVKTGDCLAILND